MRQGVGLSWVRGEVGGHTINYPLKETETAWAHTVRLTMIPLPILGVDDPEYVGAGRLEQGLSSFTVKVSVACPKRKQGLPRQER